jgi:hypothetical protein
MIRDAVKGDAQVIFDLMRGLAVYEKAEHTLALTVEELDRDLFENHSVGVLLAIDDETNKAVGFAMHYNAYSSRKGKCSLYPQHTACLFAYRCTLYK